MLPDFDLKVGGSETLTRQLYGRLRKLILAGSWPPGFRLPSSRDLARHLKVSRNTVSLVIDQLAMEGYIEVVKGRRPIVSPSKVDLVVERRANQQRTSALRVSSWAERLRQADWPFLSEGAPRAFLPGRADARAFPHDIWARCLRRAARYSGSTLTTGVNRPSLQASLLRHLVENRGVNAEMRQILIVPSAQAAIELTARVLLDPGDIAWHESPGYGGAKAALEAAGASVRGIGLDRAGIEFDKRTDEPRLVFVTPSHQYPTGQLMPINRRRELLAFVDGVGAAIIEDDYDSEFQYDGKPVAALQGLDVSGSVFYVGTFSKSMYSDIRTGYVIVPSDMIGTFERAQRHSGHAVSAHIQEALAEFIDGGYLAMHIRKMSRIYRNRRDHLVQSLISNVGGALTVSPPAGGMQLVARLPSGYDDCDVASVLAKAGVTSRPLSKHFSGEIGGHGLFLGFSAWNEGEIDAGVGVIKSVLKTMRLLR